MNLEKIVKGINELVQPTAPIPGDSWRLLRQEEKVWYTPRGALHTIVATQWVQDAGFSELATANLIPYERIEAAIDQREPFQLDWLPSEIVYNDTFHAILHPKLPREDQQMDHVRNKHLEYIKKLGMYMCGEGKEPEKYSGFDEIADLRIPIEPQRKLSQRRIYQR